MLQALKLASLLRLLFVNLLRIDQQLGEADFDLVAEAELMGLILGEYSPNIIRMFMGIDVGEVDFFAGLAELEQKL